MRLVLKFNLVLLVIFALGFAAAAVFSRSLLEKSAREDVLQDARLILPKRPPRATPRPAMPRPGAQSYCASSRPSCCPSSVRSRAWRYGAAPRAGTRAELLRLLSDAIAGERGYPALLERLPVVLAEPIVTGAAQRISSAPPTASEPTAPEPTAIAPEAVDRVTRALAISIGPIAKVMTKKALLKATSYLDLCMALSERSSTEAEKDAFLKAVGIR